MWLFSSQDWGVFLSCNNSCALLPRVLESLLVSLVTTVVVFMASMVLGECRQMSSSSQIGNDSFQLQVTPVHLLPLSSTHKKKRKKKRRRIQKCMTCLCLGLVDTLGSLLCACVRLLRDRGICSGLSTEARMCTLCPFHFGEESWTS